jgi:hypothetical protein
MRFLQIIVLAVLVVGAAPQTTPRADVLAAIDHWQNRTSTRDSILKIGGDPLPALVSIANSKDESVIHRTHAIGLLATFHDARAEAGFIQLTNDGNPMFRCFGLQSLSELKSRGAVPTLISKLDDRETCMTMNSTDPPQKSPIYVSDEAVRLLELVTGQSFEPKFMYGHRKTEPWKKWWLEQKADTPSQLPKEMVRVFDGVGSLEMGMSQLRC